VSTLVTGSGEGRVGRAGGGCGKENVSIFGRGHE